MQEGEVEFVVRDGQSIAYEVFGDGPIDLVVWHGNRFPIDLMWELPQLAEFMDALGKIARVIVYDPRGYGSSDPLPTTDGAAGSESAAADMLAVLDEVRADRVNMLNLGGTGSALFVAATYPERINSLIFNYLAPSVPQMRGFTFEQRMKFARALSTTRALRSDNPRVAHDPALQRWWGRSRRLGSSPEATARQMELAANMDADSLLRHVQAPTLVLARSAAQYVWDVETSRAAAAQIPNCRFVELPGSEVDLFLGDTAPVLTEITAFLRQEPDAPAPDDRALATVLFTDIVSSTERLANVGDENWRHMLDEHEEDADRIIREYRGRIVRNTGDGILATFDGPARGVRCAAALLASTAHHGITLRAGLHTGEIELRPPDIAGIAVHTASRIADLAGPNEILVSRTVIDLTAGSGLEFEPRGEHQLKGVPGTWPIFAARSDELTATP